MIMYPGATWTFESVNAGIAMNLNKHTSTNMPFVTYDERAFGEGPLYKSKTEQALLTDKMVLPNFGQLPTGLIMGIVSSGSKVSACFPADFAVTATSASGTSVVVAEDDAKFFEVGMAIKSGTTTTTVTAKSAASSGSVTLTVADSVSSTTITYPFTQCVVLDQPVLALEEGSYTSVIYSNAVLYKNKMINKSEALLTALNAFEDGPWVVIR